MKHGMTIKIVGFIALVLYISMMPQILRPALGKGVKTSYKRYSIFNYKNEDFLCEPYTVNQDDWLYKIFRKKGEISEKDFPHFLIIFKEINPEISNIDAIEPGFHILIPLKKVEKGDYDQITPGTVDVPVIEFSTMKEDLDLKPFLRQHTIKKGDNVSSLIDKDFLAKGGGLSEEGLKAFQLANPNVKNIDIVYEGTDIYLPDPAIKSQPWFQSFLSGNAAPEPETGEKDKELKQSKLEAYKLTQLKKYSSLIGGTLLSHGKMYFPAAPGRTMPGKPDHDQVLDLSSAPIIETDDGTKILIISGENVNDELLKSVQTYWRGLKIQLMSEAVDTLKSAAQTKASALGNITREYKQIIETLLAQTDYDYVPDVKIPFTLNNITLEAAFGRVIREDTTDLLINFGNVYGAALEVLEKREFEIMSIPPRITVPELVRQLFTHLGYATWNDPSFSTGETVETLKGIYASREEDKVFIPNEPMSRTALSYLKKENIKILSLNRKPLSQ